MLAATLVAILVAACGGGSGGGPGMPTISAGGGPSGGTVKVALLLPLTSSGNTPAVAKALKQAAGTARAEAERMKHDRLVNDFGSKVERSGLGLQMKQDLQLN